jgi:hypothetical protein
MTANFIRVLPFENFRDCTNIQTPDEWKPWHRFDRISGMIQSIQPDVNARTGFISNCGNLDAILLKSGW